MNIVLDRAYPEAVAAKYLVLELDTFRSPDDGSTVTAWAVVEKVPLEELPRIDEFRSLHQQLIENYRRQHWSYCENAIEHLRSRWFGDLASFYDDLRTRIEQNKSLDLDADWDGYIVRSFSKAA